MPDFHIELTDLAKRYRNEWIFRSLSLQIPAGSRCAVTGPNGSGKSTLLKVLSGHLTPSKGQIRFFSGQKEIEKDDLYRSLTFAAPYVEMIEELSLRESLNFHSRFRPFEKNLTTVGVASLLGFQKSLDKPLRFFSSGMKQRLKLALALCSSGSLILLDEPTTNLDAEGAAWYHRLVDEFAADRLLVVASNVEDDYRFCELKIPILDFK